LETALKEQGGEERLYRVSYTVSITNADATLADVRQALDMLLANTRPGDTVIVALSGHGIKKGDATYFAPVRFDPENVEGTGLPWAEIVAKLQQARQSARSVWLLADCCRAAPGLQRTLPSPLGGGAGGGVQSARPS